jgi:cell division protein FtsL
MRTGIVGAVLWIGLVAGIGVGLFLVKHEVKELEHRLNALNAEIRRNQETSHVLRAEWSYLNDPARLRTLAEKHLAMHPVRPVQMATLDTVLRDGLPGSATRFAEAPAKPAPSIAATRFAEAPAKAAAAPAAKLPVAPLAVATLAAPPRPTPPPPAPRPAAAPAPAPAPVVAAPAFAATSAPASARKGIVVRSPALAQGDQPIDGEPR